MSVNYMLIHVSCFLVHLSPRLPISLVPCLPVSLCTYLLVHNEY